MIIFSASLPGIDLLPDRAVLRIRFSIRDGCLYVIYDSGAFCAGTHLRNGRRTSWCGERSAVGRRTRGLLGSAGFGNSYLVKCTIRLWRSWVALCPRAVGVS